MLLPRLDQIGEAYLLGLCDDATMESSTLEFKLELSGIEDKRELHKDLCSLANAAGGDIVVGIAQVAGAASIIMPLSAVSIDSVRRRIAQAIDQVEPRLQGIVVHPVEVAGGFVIVVRVPASFDGPHSYRVDNTSGARKFVLRNGSDTTDMNFDQIRTAFDRTATLAERAREFIQQRFDAVARRQTWKPFLQGPIAAVALVPLPGLAGRGTVDIAAINTAYNQFMFPDWHSVNRVMNLDGLVVYMAVKEGDAIPAYTQIYRNGAIVGLRTAAAQVIDKPIIPSSTVTKFYRDAVFKFVRASVTLGFTGPAVLRCVLTNVSGYQLGVGETNDPWGKSLADTDRDLMMLPDIWIDAVEAIETAEQADVFVQPMMDVLWQAFDLERCLEYNLSGKWTPRGI